jgi:outer membrane lipoprotein carrier protein
MRTVLALVVALAPVTASAQSADAVLERAVATYSTLNSVRVEFRQTLTNPLTGNKAATTGVLLRKKPNLLNISFDNGDRIVADGTNLWLYLPSSVPGQVIRTPVKASSSATFDPAGELLVSPRTRYSAASAGTAVVGDRNAHIVVLTPKAADVPFTKARLWVDDADGTVRQFEVTDANGLERFITITKLASNPNIARKEFSFTPPAGVKVVDQLSFAR